MAASPEVLWPAPPMTRCECTELRFEEIPEKLERENLSLEDLGKRTGCGQTCTACLPDLKAFLASRR
jgi:bacterioferritin-associated ferredoxin